MGPSAIRYAGLETRVRAPGRPNRPGPWRGGNVHGMPLGAALGAAGDAFTSEVYPTPSITRAALIGIRSLDPGERALIRELDVRVFTMNEVDRHGMERVMT